MVTIKQQIACEHFRRLIELANYWGSSQMKKNGLMYGKWAFVSEILVRFGDYGGSSKCLA